MTDYGQPQFHGSFAGGSASTASERPAGMSAAEQIRAAQGKSSVVPSNQVVIGIGQNTQTGAYVGQNVGKGMSSEDKAKLALMTQQSGQRLTVEAQQRARTQAEIAIAARQQERHEVSGPSQQAYYEGQRRDLQQNRVAGPVWMFSTKPQQGTGPSMNVERGVRAFNDYAYGKESYDTGMSIREDRPEWQAAAAQNKSIFYVKSREDSVNNFRNMMYDNQSYLTDKSIREDRPDWKASAAEEKNQAINAPSMHGDSWYGQLLESPAGKALTPYEPTWMKNVGIAVVEKETSYVQHVMPGIGKMNEELNPFSKEKQGPKIIYDSDVQQTALTVASIPVLEFSAEARVIAGGYQLYQGGKELGHGGMQNTVGGIIDIGSGALLAEQGDKESFIGLSYRKSELPTLSGKTAYKGFVARVGKNDYPIIGSYEGSVKLGTRGVGVDFASLGGEEGTGFRPASMTEWKVFKKSVAEGPVRPGFTPDIMAASDIILREIIMHEKTKSSFIQETLGRQTKTLSQEQVGTVVTSARNADALTFGSYPSAAQMPNPAQALETGLPQGRPPDDIDMRVSMGREGSQAFATKLSSDLNLNQGPKTRISKESPLLIESGISDNWPHAVDIHNDILTPEDKVTSENVFGGELGQAPVIIEGNKVMPLSEQLLRKGGSVLAIREEGIMPASHRAAKDKGDLYDLAKVLDASKKIGGGKTKEDFASLMRIFPVKENTEPIESPLLDYTEASPKQNGKLSLQVFRSGEMVNPRVETYKVASTSPRMVDFRTASQNSGYSQGSQSSTSPSPGYVRNATPSLSMMQSPNNRTSPSTSSTYSKASQSPGRSSPGTRSPSLPSPGKASPSSGPTSKSPGLPSMKSPGSSPGSRSPSPGSPGLPSIFSGRSSPSPSTRSGGFDTGSKGGGGFDDSLDLDKGFNVEVKRKGIFRKVNREPLSRKDALNLGEFTVGHNASATFRLKKTNAPAIGAFGKRGISSDFYKKKDQDDTFVEKASRRIKSIGELSQITFKGVQANRKRGGLF